MIGFYNHTVVLTYVAVVSSVLGIFVLSSGKIELAIVFLMVSGICDVFDGKVARFRDKRNSREKIFGIQIDSLSDVICFGLLPAMLNYRISIQSEFNDVLIYNIFSVVISLLFVVAAVIRLGYFNVVEQERQSETSEERKVYQGLPVTTCALILPLFYLLNPYIGMFFPVMFNILMLLISILFVSNIKVTKVGIKGFVTLLAISFTTAILIIIF